MVIMMVCHVNGSCVIEWLNALPFSNRLLKDTHKTLMQGVRGENKLPGEFRTSQNWIGVSLKNAIYIPPHQDYVVDLMSDLEKFVNEETNVPHLIKIAIAHYQFETIHPFLDGNGRLGRLMITLYLASFNQLHKPALYLSDYFERNKVEYVDRLMAVRLSSDMKAWLIFFLHGVLETSKNSIQVFKDVIALKSKLEGEVLPYFSARRQQGAQELMRHLYQAPVVRIKEVAELLNIQVNTAAALIKDFEKYGVLVKLTVKKRSQLFGFSEYMAIFDRKTEVNSYKTKALTPKDTQEDTPEDTPEDTTELSQESIQEMDWKIVDLVSGLNGALSRVEIQSLLNLKDAEHVRQQYILPALKMGAIEMTLPDKPSSRLQKYRLTLLGHNLQKHLQS
jgi:Fic family protein